jgi:phosphomannomutase
MCVKQCIISVMKPIEFGTDGWRGVISFDFTFPRTVLVVEAVRRHLVEAGKAERPMLLAHDNRFLAREFAANAANYLQASGMRALMFKHSVPTPVCAFAVRAREAAGALMFTASHNPYYYLGIKFIPDFAGPAEAETTKRITELIRELEREGFTAPELATNWDGDLVAIKDDYFRQLDSLVNAPALRTLHGEYLYAAFHGAGAGWLDEYLQQRGVKVHSHSASRDVLFGGHLPDPSPENLLPLVPLLEEKGYELAFATDGDADRFGVISRSGTYYGCNQILPMLAEFLLTVKGLSGPLVRTVATSHQLDRVAAKHGVALLETPVGFKYVGKALREGALIGGEESGGLSVAGHVPEKDGILSIVLLLDMLATSGVNLDDAYASFCAEYGESHFVRIDLRLTMEQKAHLLEVVATAVGASEFLGRDIALVNTTDGTKFVFTGGEWILFRPSGTELVVRVYMEARDKRTFAELKSSAEAFINEHTA